MCRPVSDWKHLSLQGTQFDLQVVHRERGLMQTGFAVCSWRLHMPEQWIYYDIVKNNNVTLNNHELGISPQTFKHNSKLSQQFQVPSINYNSNNKPFVSTIEPLPISSSATSLLGMIYGVQYHPEKNGFEYGLYPNTTIPYENINHSSEGITLSLYLSKFFVQNVVKRNIMNNQGKSKYTEPNQYPLIYTYPRNIGYNLKKYI
jgi:gamma-glutamyl hydrolase